MYFISNINDKKGDCDDLRNAEYWIQQQCGLCLLLLFLPVSKPVDLKGHRFKPFSAITSYFLLLLLLLFPT